MPALPQELKLACPELQTVWTIMAFANEVLLHGVHRSQSWTLVHTYVVRRFLPERPRVVRGVRRARATAVPGRHAPQSPTRRSAGGELRCDKQGLPRQWQRHLFVLVAVIGIGVLLAADGELTA